MPIEVGIPITATDWNLKFGRTLRELHTTLNRDVPELEEAMVLLGGDAQWEALGYSTLQAQTMRTLVSLAGALRATSEATDLWNSAWPYMGTGFDPT